MLTHTSHTTTCRHPHISTLLDPHRLGRARDRAVTGTRVRLIKMAAAGPSSSSLSVVPRPAHASPAPLAVAPAAKSSILGRGLSLEQRVCVLGLIVLSLPHEDQALPPGRWNIMMLRTVARLLRLADGHWMALQPLLYSEGNDVAGRKMQLEAFRRPFFPAAAPDLVEEESREAEDRETKEQKSKALQVLRLTVLRDLLVHLACAGLYDARSRHLLMSLAADGFALDWREVAKVCVRVCVCLYGRTETCRSSLFALWW